MVWKNAPRPGPWPRGDGQEIKRLPARWPFLSRLVIGCLGRFASRCRPLLRAAAFCFAPPPFASRRRLLLRAAAFCFAPPPFASRRRLLLRAAAFCFAPPPFASRR